MHPNIDHFFKEAKCDFPLNSDKKVGGHVVDKVEGIFVLNKFVLQD